MDRFVARVKAILLTPKTEWSVIDGREPAMPTTLFTNYVAILAAIPAVASLIGYADCGARLGKAVIVGRELLVSWSPAQPLVCRPRW